MGGQLIKGYSIQGDSQGVVGLTKSWKLYRAKKAGAHVQASIFLIEKRQIKKSDREQMIKIAKKQASNLVRVRHPGVLAVVQPLTEDENILAFVAERVQGTMSQLIKQGKLNEYMASELQLKLFLYPFLQAVSFIHDTLKQAHLALSLDNIYITTDGTWKLAGFGSNQLLTNDDIHVTQEKLYDYSYSAPELALSKHYNRKTDNFSIGVIILRLMQFIHKQYKPLPLGDKIEYDKHTADLKKMINSKVISKSSNPNDLQQLLKGLLEWQNGQRFNLSDALVSRWMNDSTLTTVKYLDKISSYENKQQLQFLKGLAGVLDDFHHRVVTRIILPKLLDLLKFGHLVASIIFITIDLLKKDKVTSVFYRQHIWPALKNITQGKEINAQTIYVVVLHMDVLQKAIGEADSITYLLPLYIKCFDCPPKLKHLALINLQRLSKKIQYQVFKTRVVPKLLHILKDPVIETRKDALRGLYAIIKVIDVQTMSISVVPALEGARKAGSDPFINSIINTIYIVLTNSLPIDIISGKILPVLIPYLSDPSINRTEFYQFKTTIINMINRIQKEREKHFDNTAVGKDEQTFTEADFRFSEEEHKPKPEIKGNYNFLNNYMEVKKEKQNIPQQISHPPINNNTHTTSIITPQINYTNIVVNPSIKGQQTKDETFSYNTPLQFTPLQMNPIIIKDTSLQQVKPQMSTPISVPNVISEGDDDFNFDNTVQITANVNNTFSQSVTYTPQIHFPPVPQQTFIKQPQKYQPIQIQKIQKKQPKRLSRPKISQNVSDQIQIMKIGNATSYIKPKDFDYPKMQFPPSTNSFNFGYPSSNIPPSKNEGSIFSVNLDNAKDFDLNSYNYPAPTINITTNNSNTNNKNINPINVNNIHIHSIDERNLHNNMNNFSNSVNNNGFTDSNKEKSIKPIIKPISKPLNQKQIFRSEEPGQIYKPENDKSMMQPPYNFGSSPVTTLGGLESFNLNQSLSINNPFSKLQNSSLAFTPPIHAMNQGSIMNDLYSVFEEEEKKGTFHDDFNLI